VKIYVAAGETLRKKERGGETQETLMYFFAGSFLISPCV
jgi:hypothetical protein